MTAQKEPKTRAEKISLLNKYYCETSADKFNADDITALLSVYINNCLEVAHKDTPSKNDVRVGPILQHVQDSSEKGIRKARVRLESLRLGFSG